MNKELQEKHILPKLDEAHLVLTVNAKSGDITMVMEDGLSWDFLFNLPDTILEHLIKVRDQQEEKGE